ncbi:hypothetical protein IQ249_11155 [Lusitaniella coriacea LEGE 07157]|uniref:Uncharacterized protein n=1 Tax=Lusitaniella coriacea LEGE 07157 TaxID=945747 RepID=A0A8J7DWP3_9CYAN|nr:hypothetical protein [Lusitaniella coriacea]MBE9116457.1 hypothetical protein [Lusitaniella coriacea LEGE 07157]
MKRRKVIEYGLLGSTTIFLNYLFPANQNSIAQMNKKPSYDWIFLYWIPYDNNLSHFGKPILKIIDKGVRNNNLLVAVQMDLWNATQLSRTVITQAETTTQELQTNNSANVRVFSDYLD